MPSLIQSGTTKELSMNANCDDLAYFSSCFRLFGVSRPKFSDVDQSTPNTGPKYKESPCNIFLLGTLRSSNVTYLHQNRHFSVQTVQCKNSKVNKKWAWHHAKTLNQISWTSPYGRPSSSNSERPTGCFWGHSCSKAHCFRDIGWERFFLTMEKSNSETLNPPAPQPWPYIIGHCKVWNPGSTSY